MKSFGLLPLWIVVFTVQFVSVPLADTAEHGPLPSVLKCRIIDKSEKREKCFEAEQTILDIVGESEMSEEQVARALLEAASEPLLDRKTTHEIACSALELVGGKEQLELPTIGILQNHAFETDHKRYEDCTIRVLHFIGWRSDNGAYNLLMDSISSKGTAGNEYSNTDLLEIVDQISDTARFQRYNIYTLGMLRRRLTIDEYSEFCKAFFPGSQKKYNNQHAVYVAQTLARTYSHDSGCFDAIIDELSGGANENLYWTLLADQSGGQDRLLLAIMSGLKANRTPHLAVRQARAQLDKIWIDGSDVPWMNDFSMLKDRAEHSDINEGDAYVGQLLNQFPQGRARKYVSLLARTAQKDAYKTAFLTDSELKHIVQEGQIQSGVEDAFIGLDKNDFEVLASFPEDEQLLAIQMLASAGGGWSAASHRHSRILYTMRMKRIVELSDAAWALYNDGQIEIREEILVHYPWNKKHKTNEDWSPDTFVVGKPDRKS